MGIDENRLKNRSLSRLKERRASFRSLLCESLERRDLMAAAPVFAPGTSSTYMDSMIRQLARMGAEGGDGGGSGGSGNINLQGSRWSNPVGGPSPNLGDPATVTWSIVPDGTPVANLSGGTTPSNLVAFMDGLYGGGSGLVSDRPWFNIFAKTYDTWSAVSGLKFVYEPQDDGAPSQGAARGVAGIRGDVRIGGNRIDGDYGILAFNFFPNGFGDVGTDGDMVIDTSDAFYRDFSDGPTGENRGLFNVLAHEAGHGIGLGHVIPVNETKLMEPIATVAFSGPQHDDIIAAQTVYGDDYENNDVGGTASNLGVIGTGSTQLRNLSIDRSENSDYFLFTVGDAKVRKISVIPQGFEYSVGPQFGSPSLTNSRLYRNLSFQIERLTGEVVASASSAAIGLAEVIANAGLSAGTYYLRINGTAGETQLYDLVFEADSIKSSGPILIGVQPNNSELIENGAIRTVAPRELTFRFDDKQIIDPSTTKGIRVTRAGGDGSFGLRSASSDFGTDGRVDIQLTSKVASESLSVSITSEDLGTSKTHELSMSGTSISIKLNSRPGSRVTAEQLVQAINAPNSLVVSKLAARVNGGLPSAELGAGVPVSPIQLTSNNDLVIEPGAVIIGDTPNENEVTLRFAENLPDDMYRLEVFGFDDPSRGVTGLRNVNGDLFLPSDPRTRQDTIEFRLDIGSKITGVVPQPVLRDANGKLDQKRNRIDVYFDDEKFLVQESGGKPISGTVEDVKLYQLIVTKNSVRNTDDVIYYPNQAIYNASSNTVTLVFDRNIDEYSAVGTPSSFRLRIGTSETVPSELNPLKPVLRLTTERGSTFDTAESLGVFGLSTSSQTSLLLTGEIDPEIHQLDSLGSNSDPGTRQVPEAFENYINPNFTGDRVAGIQKLYYNFKTNYGSAANPQTNAITEKQKSRIREAFSLWSDRLGVQFVETPSSGLTMAVGSLSVLDPRDPNVQTRDVNGDTPTSIPDFRVKIDPKFETSLAIFSADYTWQDNYGEDFTRAAAASIGLMLGLANAGDADPSTLMRFDTNFLNNGADRNFEPIFPGNLDVLRGSFLHRPESSDIDLYRFEVAANSTGSLTKGSFVAEVLAERNASSSPLDARLALFKQTQATAVSNLGAGGNVEVEFTAKASGKLGNNLQVFVTRSERGLGKNPLVAVFPNAISIDLNSTELSESTLDDFIKAIENDVDASSLISVKKRSGDLSTKLGNRAITYSPIVLGGGRVDLLSQNDDYFGKDSLIRMDLDPGVYYIGVSASGNSNYDATTPDTGWGGRTQGRYDLRLTYRSQVDGETTLRDFGATASSTQSQDLAVPLDGDADGVPGGVYNFWFDARPLDRVLRFNAGAPSDLEGKIVTITGSNGVVRRFEFSADTTVGTGNIRVLYTPFYDATALASSLRNAINSRPESEIGVRATSDGARVTLKGERLVQLSSNLSVIDFEGKTIFVDKSAGPSANGSLDRPFNNISGSGVPNAFAAAVPGDIIRIVGNGGSDGRLDTVADNMPYEIGFGLLAGSVLADGQTMDVPKGVSVMVDAGAIFKMRRSRIGVGSSTIGVDRSGGALQVLGTPKLLDAAGKPMRNTDGSLATGHVFFTSWLDEKTGVDSYVPSTTPSAGDWGGIVFKRDLDKSVGRFDLEDEGIFRQYVNFADIKYGGSSAVVIDSVQQTVNSVQINDMRPTVTFNRISLAADSAISATPDSFEETLFSDPRYQRKGSFTPDYDRVGPKIYGNQLTKNSINGMFIKVSTPVGGSTRQLTVAGRFDDTDVVHVIAENIIVQGNPGGGLLDTFLVPSNLISLQGTSGGTLAAGTYLYKLTFVDSNGYETPPSDPSQAISLGVNQTAIRIAGLPGVGNGYVSRRLYRSVGSTGEYRLVAELDGSVSDYFDRGGMLSDAGDPKGSLLRDRPDVSGVAVVQTTDGALPGFLPLGSFTYRVVMIDETGRESLVSAPTTVQTTTPTNRTLRLDSLPFIQAGYSGFRIYRSAVGGVAPFSQIAEITDPAVRSFTDNGTAVLVRQLSVESFGNIRPRLDASLAIDPGTIIKLEGARIELGHSTQLLAEGVDGGRIVMTSRQDDRYGAGGTFDTNNNGINGAMDTRPGDWSGIYASPDSTISLDNVVLANAGGISRIEGTFKAFSPIEIQQAHARIANSVLEGNANGMGGQGPIDRLGRPANENYPLGNNASRGSTVFVRGSQPIFLNNILQNNKGSAITIDVNSMDAELRGDVGRQTGMVGRNLTLDANRGPLFRGNRLYNNDINGLEIRADAATNDRSEGVLSVRDLPRNLLNTESVWDDTDLVHVLFDSVVVSNLQHFGGLRLQSAVNESLVIKLEGQGSNFDHERGTGFTATGRYSSIRDRVGGTIQVLGMPGFPVVFTSLRDDSVGAGTQPDGLPQNDTNNDGIATIARAGDWRSLVFDSYSNDRNVRAVMEAERPNVSAPGVNDSTVTSQFLGTLALNPSTSDENLILGWNVNGVLSEPGDQDVYSFTGTAGTEVWFDIDYTELSLDTVLEILNANGDLLARSDDSAAEQVDPSLLVVDPALDINTVNPVVQRARGAARRHASGQLKEDGTTNPRDAGLRMVLPGIGGATSTFFFRIRSKGIDIANSSAGLTSGAYAIQVRLRDQQEFAGSTIQYADIRYSTNGVHTLGLPYASPLTGEAHSGMYDADPFVVDNPVWSTSPDNQPNLINLGSLQLTNKGAISVAGELPTTGVRSQTYRFNVGDLASSYVGNPASTSTYPVVIDVDYADGLNRSSLLVSVLWDQDNDPATPGLPVNPLVRDRNFVVDDLPSPLSGNDLSDLSRGSVGTGDAFLNFIGSAELRRGTYEIVVTDRNPFSGRSGLYQMEIRVGDKLGSTVPRYYRGSYSTSIEFLPGLTIPSGSRVEISDGSNLLTFEFTLTGSVDFGNVPVRFDAADTPRVLAGKFRDAINQVFQQNRLNVKAADLNRNVTGSSDSVIDLFGNVKVFDLDGVFSVGGISGILEFDGFGDRNSNRDQGQFVISNTIVTQARDYAVWAAPAERYYADGRAQQPLNVTRSFFGFEFEEHNYVGAPGLGGAYARNLPVDNVVPFGAAGGPARAANAGVAPGLVVVNNIFDSAGLGGLHIQGEAPTWRITAFPGLADLSTETVPDPPDHSGSYLDDSDLMEVTFGRQRVRFEFEDIAGAPQGAPSYGSGTVGGNGWNSENIPIYYREDGGSQYLRAPNTSPGYAVDEVVKAIRDAFLGSVMTTNGTTQRISSWVEPLQDEIVVDPDNVRTWIYPTASIIVKGPQNIAFLNSIGFGNPLEIERLGEYTASPFVRAINNTIIGKDGRASLNPESVDSSTNDTLRGAAETFQGISVNPQSYAVNGTLDADPLSTGSSDVDFYKFQLGVGDRVRIDIDTPRGSTLDSAMKLFNSSGIAQVISNSEDPLTSDNQSAPGEPSGLDPYIDFTATQAGVYYVAVSAVGNTKFDAFSFADRRRGATSGSYGLNIQVLKPEDFVIVADDPNSYIAPGQLNGETITIEQIPDLVGGTTNSRTFQFTRDPGYSGDTIPIYIGEDFRVPDVARAIANAITASGMSNSQALPNGIFGTASPLAPVSAVAIGGENGYDPNYGLVGGGDRGLNSGNARGAQLQAGLNRYRGIDDSGWSNDESPFDLIVNIGQTNGVTSSSSTFQGHSHRGFGHDRTMSLPFLPTIDRPVTSQGNGTSEKFVVVRNAYRITSSNPNRRIAGRAGSNNMNQIIPETGIMVSGGASPTLLNNTFINVQSPIVQERPTFRGADFRGSADLVSARPSAVVVGGNTYQYAETATPVTNLGLVIEANPTNVPNTGLDFNFIAGNSERLFVDFTGANFLPNPQSQIIDSSIDSMPEREGFRAVKQAVGIAPSPILAPDRDFYGLFRSDDPNVAPPSGLGGSIFKDRGAIDRADFVGPSAIAVNPVDNDARRVDVDPISSVIELSSGVYPEFRIQLQDGFESANLGGGTGIDDTSVVGSEQENRSPGAVVTITENNRLLIEGIDYVFSYNTTTNEVVLKPLAGVWKNDRVYDITINNKDRFVVDAVTGNRLNDGDSFSIRDSNGSNVTFEFDSGFRLQLPIGLQLNLPFAGGGAGGIADGEWFAVTVGAARKEFEFDIDSAVTTGREKIEFTTTQTKSDLADAIVKRINETFGGTAFARKLGTQDVFIAAPAGAAVKTDGAPSLVQPSQTLGLLVPSQGAGFGGVVDAQTFSITDGSQAVVFEFDADTVPKTQPGNVRIDISEANTSLEVAQKMLSAIKSTMLRVEPSIVGNRIVHLGLPDTGRVDLITANLEVVGVSRPIQDGDYVSISRGDGSSSSTFEFDSTGGVAAGRVAVPFNKNMTQSEIGAALAAAINTAIPGLPTTHFGNGSVVVEGLATDTISVTGAPTIDLSGQPGVQGNTTLQIYGNLLLAVPTLGGLDLKDGETFNITNNGTTVSFEFDNNFSVSNPGAVSVPFTNASTPSDLVTTIVNRINGTARLGLVARAAGVDRVDLGSLDNSAVTIVTNTLQGKLKTERGLPQDGDSFVINDGARSITFEFINTSIDNIANPAMVPIRYSNSNTLAEVYGKMEEAIKNSVLKLSSVVTAQGLKLGDTSKFIYSIDNASSLRILGVPGGSVAIPFVPDPSFTAEQVRDAIIRRINELASEGLTTLQSKVRGGSTLFVENAVSIGDGVSSFFLRGVQDVVGNFLKSNRFNNETQFTILMPGVKLDFGDAPDPVGTTGGRYSTLKSNDGARHVIVNGLALGSSVTTELDGKPQEAGDGDRGDDGVTFKFQRNDYGSTGNPIFNKNVDTSVTVTMSSPGILNGWIDFNADGDWSDPGEHVLRNKSFGVLNPLTQTFSIRIPTNSPNFATATQSFARFRASTEADLSPTGLALDGEVEDYVVSLVPGRPPVGVNENYTLNEDTGSLIANDALGTDGAAFNNGVLANDTNLDGRTLKATIISEPSAESTKRFVFRTDGTFEFTPADNFFGTTTFVYLSSDDIFDSKTLATATITVISVNDKPTAGPLSFNIDEDTVLEISQAQILAVTSVGPPNEVSEGQEITIVEVISPSQAGGGVRFEGGKLTYTPPTDFSGVDRITYQIRDNGTTGGLPDPQTAIGTITINVADKNDPPITTPKSLTTTEGIAAEISISAIVAGDTAGPPNEILAGQKISFTGVQPTSARGGKVEISGTKVSYTPPQYFNGTDTFFYIVSDDGLSGTVSDPRSSIGTVTVTVSPVNDSPMIRQPFGTVVMQEDQLTAVTLTLSDYFTDPDIATNGDSLTYEVEPNGNSNPSLIEPTIVNGQLRLSPKADQNGTAVIRIRAKDTGSPSLSVTNILTVQVTPTPDAPRLVKPLPDRTVNEDSAPINIDLSPEFFFDPDVVNGDILTFNVASSNTNIATVSVSGNRLTVTLKPNAFGNTTISVTARDIAGGTVSDSFVLTVDPVNDDTPVARNDAYTSPLRETLRTIDATGLGTPTTNDDGVLANDSDVDGQSLTATLVTAPTRGSVVVNTNGTFVYTPFTSTTVKPGDTDSFRYRATDPTGRFSEATVTITFGQPLPAPYQNPANSNDVNADGWVTPIDVLLVINLLNSRGSGPTAGLPAPPDYVDVNGDNQVDPLDVLALINFINSRGNGEGEARGEGEGAAAASSIPYGWSFDVGRGLFNAQSGLRGIPGYENNNKPVGSFGNIASWGSGVTAATSEPRSPSSMYLGLQAEEEDLDKLASDVARRDTSGNQTLVDQVFANLFDE